jgi:hypothetical protein
MSQAELFDFPIKELPDRYSIARSAIYVRMKRLNITPHTQGNRSYINASELELLDELHEFLVEDSSRTIDEFLKRLSSFELNELGLFPKGQLTRKQTQNPTTESVRAVEYNQISKAAHLRERFEFLERASAKRWLLSTSDLAQLMELSPSTVVKHEQLSRWGFSFVKCSERTGREVNWTVKRPSR